MKDLFFCDSISFFSIILHSSIHIPRHTITSVVGKSGSGKTTFLSFLNGTKTPSTGSIFYKNTEIFSSNIISHRRKVILVEQKPVLFPGTVKDNLLLGLNLTHQPLPDDGILKKYLNQFKLTFSLQDTSINLSVGEAQRVCIIRCLLMKPEVLLLDEPTSALDSSTAKLTLQYLFEEHKKSGIELIYVSHAKELYSLADNTLIFNEGRILSDGC